MRFDFKELKIYLQRQPHKNLYDIFPDKKDGFELNIIDKKIKKISLDKNQIKNEFKYKKEGSSSGKNKLSDNK